MAKRLQIVFPRYFSYYKKKQKFTLRKHFNRLKQVLPSVESFRFYLTSSAINSSQIEGVSIDFNTYFRYLTTPGVKSSKDIKQVQDLVQAYEFAQQNSLNLANIFSAHKLLSQQLVTKKYQGRYRDQEVHIYNLETGQKIYTGAPVDLVESEMKKLFDDIILLQERQLTIDQIFYYASFIHLIFAKVHPLC